MSAELVGICEINKFTDFFTSFYVNNNFSNISTYTDGLYLKRARHKWFLKINSEALIPVANYSSEQKPSIRAQYQDLTGFYLLHKKFGAFFSQKSTQF